MKRHILIYITIILLMAGCDKNDDAQPIVNPNQEQESVQDIGDTTSETGAAPVFEAGFENENNETRTFLDENVKMLWSADDEISVFYHNTFNRRYCFDGDTGDNSGTFSHAASTDINTGSELATNYAVYPYSNDTSIAEDGTISITLPAVQKYASKSFGVGANMMVAVTKDKDDYFLPFKNLCGYLKLKLYGDVIVKSIKLQGENNEPIAGSATVSVKHDKTPTLIMGEKATSTITLDCGEGVKLGETEESATEFWIVVPPTNFEKGFTISVVGIDGGECFSMTTKARSIERNTVLSMAAQVAEYTIPPTNVLWYTTTDGNAIDNPTADFGSSIVSNTYDNGRGTITFAENITEIPYGAFKDNTNLASVRMPNSITVIGNYAFSGCSSLASDIIIPSGVTKINDYAFYDCSSITSITIPSSVTKIGSSAFVNCGGELTVNCNIPDASTSDGAFYKSKFTNVTIGEGVTKIGYSAFRGCSSITSINIPSSVTEIGVYAFYGCSSITSLTIPESVTKIGSYAFYGCSSITSINIPSSITEIGSYAFIGCSSLASDIIIPSGVTKINDYAFYGCSSITSLTIPESVTEIGRYAFYNCGGELTVNCNIPDAINGDGIFENTNFTKVTIGEGVTKIGSYAFYGCSSITSISIPEGVTTIGHCAFKGCGGELTVNCDIPDAINGDGIFENTKFTKVTIGEGVTKIGSYAFYGCSSITSITIPSSVTEIGKYAFYGCSNITSLSIPSSVTEIGSYAFVNCGGELTVNCNIPDGNSYYDGAFYNSKFTNVTIGEGVTKIGSYAFYGCSSITSISIPEGVTTIGHCAFKGCGGELTVNCDIPDAINGDGIFENTKFTKVTISEGVTKIGSYAFYGCSSITSITIPSSVTEIGGYAFRGCSSITSLTIPSSVTKIGSYAFVNCGGELTVNCNIPDGNSYYDGAFYNSKFTNVTIGEGVTKIGSYAFYGCSSITSLTIPSSVTEIGYRAFYNCSSLKSVYCKPTTPPSLSSSVFSYNASGRMIYVPTASVDAYKSSWSSYSSAITGYTFE